MIILSVDYGDRRTGLAVCDKNETIASPVGTVKAKGRTALIEAVAAKSREYSAETIVVGLPKNMDGSEGFRAEACREFASLLGEKTGLPVCMQDERLTTVSAYTDLHAAGVYGKKAAQAVDALSAVIILEDHLRQRERRT